MLQRCAHLRSRDFSKAAVEERQRLQMVQIGDAEDFGIRERAHRAIENALVYAGHLL